MGKRPSNIYKCRPIRIKPNFSTETKDQQGLDRCIVVLKRSQMIALVTILFTVKLSITIEGENNIFHDKTKFKQCPQI